MIVDKLPQLSLYKNTHPRFAAVCEFVTSNDINNLPDGRTGIDGDNIYVNHERFEGRGMEAARFERHNKYIDIQLVLAGDEVIGWSPQGNPANPGEGYEDERDLEFHGGAPLLWIPAAPETFAIFFPSDLHAPAAGNGDIEKLIFKIRV